jgi:hypothetical protein
VSAYLKASVNTRSRESSRARFASTDAMSPDCGCVPESLPQPRHLRQWASRHTRLRLEPCFRGLRRCSCAGSQRNAPAPLDFGAPLALGSCAQSSQLYTVAPAAAPRRAARCWSPSRRGYWAALPDLELQANYHYANSSSSAFASFRSRVSKPSVNHP